MAPQARQNRMRKNLDKAAGISCLSLEISMGEPQSTLGCFKHDSLEKREARAQHEGFAEHHKMSLQHSDLAILKRQEVKLCSYPSQHEQS